MKHKVIIIGAGQHGLVVQNTLALQKNLEFSGFLDDFYKKSKERPVVGQIADFRKFKKDHLFHVALGDNQKRRKLFEMLKRQHCRFANLIHPQAIIEKGVNLGKSVFVGANTYINVRSSIGDNVIINNGCIVEHDNVIKNHTQLAPGVITGGGAQIGQNCFLGLGALIRDHIKIGNNTVIGMGTIIVKSIPANLTVYNKLNIVNKKHETLSFS